MKNLFTTNTFRLPLTQAAAEYAFIGTLEIFDTTLEIFDFSDEMTHISPPDAKEAYFFSEFHRTKTAPKMLCIVLVCEPMWFHETTYLYNQ